MSGIWTNTGEGWELGSPQGFPDERTLHNLIEENPQLLPLAGEPSLAVLGSEVQLGNGYADLLCVESSGRPAIVEVKLASNSEARRAIVSQVIAYAAFLHGTDVKSLEQGPLRKQLDKASHSSIFDAVLFHDQEGDIDKESFYAAMQEYLDRGDFRLVLVLDDVSTELTRMVAYLDAITIQALTIDLIIVKVYKVNGAQIALPQRVSSDAIPIPASPSQTRPKLTGTVTDGVDVFRASVQDAPDESRRVFNELIDRAEQWESLANVRLYSKGSIRPGEYSLSPRVMPDNAGIVAIWNDNLKPSITVWYSVLARRAPKAIKDIESAMGRPLEPRKWNTTDNITTELLDAITVAYREANGI